ncbi:MAG: TolC family protein [Myxococcota bacterium]
MHQLTIIALLSLGQTGEAPLDIPVHREPLTLERALEYAETNNERIGIAAAAVDRARAQYTRSLAALLPNVNLNGTYIRRRNEASALDENGDRVFFQRRNALQAQAQATVNLIKPDEYPRVAAADDDVLAAQSDAEQERLSLRFDAAEQFFATLANERVAKAAKGRVDVAQSAVDEARARYEAGLAAGNTVTRAELELATARVTATETGNQAEIARLTLSFILGVDVAGGLVEPASAGSSVTDSSGLFEQARAARPDLDALRHRRDAAESRQLAPVLDWFPEVSVRGLYSLTNEPGFGPNDNYQFSATLGWQVFDGGIRIADDIQANADYRDADLQIRALERNVRLEIENQLRQIGTRRALVTEARARLEVAKRNAEEVTQRLEAGLVTGLEAADSAAELFDAEAELARQQFEQRIAELALRRVVASDPLTPVNPD